jgi:DNA-binding MarR family transcriptional regulator
MDLSNSITYHITKCGNILHKLTAKKIKDAGLDITPEESVLLNQLWDKDNQTLTELGQWSVKGPSTVTRQIDGLVKKGYVERVHSDEDRRKIHARLSKEGKKLKTKFNKSLVSALDASLQDVTPQELEDTLRVILKIREQSLSELCKKS